MTCDDVLSKLRGENDTLRRFAVRSLAVFGSVARGEARDGSDVDILVEFEPGARTGLFELVRLQRHLSALLGAPVDLVTPASLRPEMREVILREAVHAT